MPTTIAGSCGERRPTSAMTISTVMAAAMTGAASCSPASRMPPAMSASAAQVVAFITAWPTGTTAKLRITAASNERSRPAPMMTSRPIQLRSCPSTGVWMLLLGSRRLTSEKLNSMPISWPAKSSASVSMVSAKPNVRPTASSPRSAGIVSSACDCGRTPTAGASKAVMAMTNPALIRGAMAAEEKSGANTINPLMRTSTSTPAVSTCGQSVICATVGGMTVRSLSEVEVEVRPEMNGVRDKAGDHPGHCDKRDCEDYDQSRNHGEGLLLNAGESLEQAEDDADQASGDQQGRTENGCLKKQVAGKLGGHVGTHRDPFCGVAECLSAVAKSF